MSDILNKYFAKHKFQYYIMNFILIASLLKLFQVTSYPEADFSEIFTAGNIEFMLFGMEDEWGGIVLTFYLAFVSIILSFVFGSILGIARWSSVKIVKIPATIFVELFRAIPHIMVIFWVFFATPVIFALLFDVKFATSALTSAIIAFTLFESAHIAEIVRAGLNSMPKGQYEAAKTLGMNPFQTFTLIILPQAYRRMIPSLVSQFVSLFKDTSLVYVIGVVEFFRASTIINNRIYMSFEILSTVAIIYFICAFTLSQIAGHLEKKVEKQINT
ncbi:MAG: amino acid ABC transporter permease [Arcobacteraceae bacterium]|nr:amino acid ABC transporter permease [Arcobacteraceae bacterium]